MEQNCDELKIDGIQVEPTFSGSVNVGAYVTIKCAQGNLYSQCGSDGTWSETSCPELGNGFRRDNLTVLSFIRVHKDFRDLSVGISIN